MWNEFKGFLARGNVLDLAIGVIIGCRIREDSNDFYRGDHYAVRGARYRRDGF
jgi:Large-conductance mechanosensitive channel, MscL